MYSYLARLQSLKIELACQEGGYFELRSVCIGTVFYSS